MSIRSMNLKILLPFGVFADKTEVVRIVAETHEGSFGILPQRLDCVASLVPGIFTYETPKDGEIFTAIDEGLLVKCGPNVLVTVRQAIGGTDLRRMRAAVEEEFLTLDEQERNIRHVITRLETSFMRRFVDLHHG